MIKTTETSKQMIKIIILMCGILTVFGGIYYHNAFEILKFAVGLSLGGGLSIIKVLMLEGAIDKALDMEQKEASNFAVMQFISRFFLSGLILVISAILPISNLWGTVFGLLCLQFSAYTVNILLKYNSRKKK